MTAENIDIYKNFPRLVGGMYVYNLNILELCFALKNICNYNVWIEKYVFLLSGLNDIPSQRLFHDFSGDYR